MKEVIENIKKIIHANKWQIPNTLMLELEKIEDTITLNDVEKLIKTIREELLKEPSINAFQTNHITPIKILPLQEALTSLIDLAKSLKIKEYTELGLIRFTEEVIAEFEPKRFKDYPEDWKEQIAESISEEEQKKLLARKSNDTAKLYAASLLLGINIGDLDEYTKYFIEDLSYRRIALVGEKVGAAGFNLFCGDLFIKQLHWSQDDFLKILETCHSKNDQRPDLTLVSQDCGVVYKTSDAEPLKTKLVAPGVTACEVIVAKDINSERYFMFHISQIWSEQFNPSIQEIIKGLYSQPFLDLIVLNKNKKHEIFLNYLKDNGFIFRNIRHLGTFNDIATNMVFLPEKQEFHVLPQEENYQPVIYKDVFSNNENRLIEKPAPRP